MKTIILRNCHGDFLEELEVKHLVRFIMYRGRLFENTNSQILTATYTQVQYLEVS